MERSIPDEAWAAIGMAIAAFNEDGYLEPSHNQYGPFPEECRRLLAPPLSLFTIDNYAEWAGAAVICPRAPQLAGTMARFDNADLFIEHGHRNPYREPGVPDWYFFWTKHYPQSQLKSWARDEGLLPTPDLPRFGMDSGLRAEADRREGGHAAKGRKKKVRVVRPWER